MKQQTFSDFEYGNRKRKTKLARVIIGTSCSTPCSTRLYGIS